MKNLFRYVPAWLFVILNIITEFIFVFWLATGFVWSDVSEITSFIPVFVILPLALIFVLNYVLYLISKALRRNMLDEAAADMKFKRSMIILTISLVLILLFLVVPILL